MQQRFSILAFFLCCTMIIGTALWYPKWEQPQTEATLSWDVAGYYLYLPAAIIYKDLKKLSFKDDITNKYHPSSEFYQAYLQENGNYVMKYPIGLAILYLPFFLLAHLFAIGTAYPTDGFSLPYQFGISWGSICIAAIGLWMMRKILLLYFSELIVGLTLILVVFATNYLNYTAIDGSMSHNWVFTLVAYLIWQTIHWYKSPSFGRSTAIAACIGLAALSRPTDILICLIPLFWGLSSISTFQERLIFWKKHILQLLLIVAVVAAIGSIQLVYWKYASGNWLVYSYQDQGFSWLWPHIKDVLFSYRKGWLVYTPIMVLSLIGFIPLYKRYRFLFWGVAIYFGLHFYLTAAWDIWWYGGSFGQRALIQAYPVLLFPIAALLTMLLTPFANQPKQIKKSNLSLSVKRIGLFLFATTCIWLNCMQTYQAHGHGFEVDAMTKAYYWRIFGKAKPTDLDKKLLDTKEDYQGERKNINSIYTNNFEQYVDTVAYTKEYAHSGNQALLISTNNKYTPTINIPLAPQKDKWLRVSAQFYTPQKEWDIWRMTQLIVQFKKQDQVIKSRMIRVQRQMGERAWQSNWTDMKIPNENFDTLSIVFWNAGSTKTLFIDDLTAEVYEAK